MNNRFRARIACGSRMVANAPSFIPAQRWASSQITKSNGSSLCCLKASAIAGVDWYVEKMTRAPDPRMNSAILDGSVVAGTPNWLTWATRWSSPPIVSSEQTGRKLNGCSPSLVQSLTICETSESDGTRTSVRCDFIASATRRPISVLPVPQARMSCPRGCDWNPRTTSAIAWSWSGRGLLGGSCLAERSSGDEGQFSLRFLRSEKNNVPTGFSCPWMTSRAL